MEEAIVEKCHEIKKQKKLVKNLLTQSVKELKDSSTQMTFNYACAETQVYIGQHHFSQQMTTEPEVITKYVE